MLHIHFQLRSKKILTLKFTIGICVCVVVLLMCIKFAFVVFIHNKSFFSKSNIASGNFLVYDFFALYNNNPWLNKRRKREQSKT